MIEPTEGATGAYEPDSPQAAEANALARSVASAFDLNDRGIEDGSLFVDALVRAAAWVEDGAGPMAVGIASSCWWQLCLGSRWSWVMPWTRLRGTPGASLRSWSRTRRAAPL